MESRSYTTHVCEHKFVKWQNQVTIKILFRGREIIFFLRGGDYYFVGWRILFRGAEIIISRGGDYYFAGGDYYFAVWRLLFRGVEIIISREGEYFSRGGIIISREGEYYFAGWRLLFRGRENIISREGEYYFAGGEYYFAGGTYPFRATVHISVAIATIMATNMQLLSDSKWSNLTALSRTYCIKNKDEQTSRH